MEAKAELRVEAKGAIDMAFVETDEAEGGFDGDLGQPEGEPQLTPTTVEEPDEPAVSEDQEPLAEPAPEPPTEPEEPESTEEAPDDGPVFMAGDREITLADLEKDPTLVNQISSALEKAHRDAEVQQTQKSQLANFQQKYEVGQQQISELQQQLMNLQAHVLQSQQPPQAQPQEQQPTPLSAEQLQNAYTPQIQRAINDKIIPPHAIEDGYGPVFGAFFHRMALQDEFNARMAQALDAQAQTLGSQAQTVTEAANHQIHAHTERVRQELVQQGGIHARLADDTAWDDFIGEVTSGAYGNPHITTEMLGKIHLASQDTAMQARQQALEQLAKRRVAEAARRAGGESVRMPPQVSPAAQNPDDPDGIFDLGDPDSRSGGRLMTTGVA